MRLLENIGMNMEIFFPFLLIKSDPNDYKIWLSTNQVYPIKNSLGHKKITIQEYVKRK